MDLHDLMRTMSVLLRDFSLYRTSICNFCRTSRKAHTIGHLSTRAAMMDKYQPTIINISPMLRLHKFVKDNDNAPLSLILPWETATERALDRFRLLYAERGFNVLTAYSTLYNFVWPKSSPPLASKIVEYLLTQTGTSPIVVHSFSIGTFMFANMIEHVLERPHQFSELQARLRGQVFDSIVIGTMQEMQIGTGAVITDYRLLQQLIAYTMSVYFYLAHNHTVKYYDRLVDNFWKNPFKTPILCFYSLVDPMCKTESIQAFVSAWEKHAGYPAFSYSVEDAEHAGILRLYPEEYRDALYKYLDTLSLDQKGSPTHSKL